MRNWFKRKPVGSIARAPDGRGLFSTHGEVSGAGRQVAMREAIARATDWPTPSRVASKAGTMDANDNEDSVKPVYGSSYGNVPEAQLMWYAQQGFIGYQMCALLAQHWLIDKACTMPGKDAVRKGYQLSLNNGQELDIKIADAIKEYDEDRFDINFNLTEFLRFGRIFGIRIAKFEVESTDPDYYFKPFNIDGVAEYAYRGISQIDPYWITPELTTEQTLRPGSIHFYEPTWWRVNGKSIHRSHLIIYRTNQVADVLKPSYFYGGVSIPQQVFERVYAAERTANEAPMLAMTKRLTVLNTDLGEALANQEKFDERMAWWAATRDNYGVKINGIGDEIQQFDTTLTEFDNLIMTQYQLVASIAGVPGTKLLGTQPKGFNSTGEFEESSYHETLESFQLDDFNRLLKRHYRLLLKSHINPQFNTSLKNITPAWNPLDAMTAQEKASVNLTKAQTGAVLITAGAIDGEVELKRIIADKDSDYQGVTLDDLPDLSEHFDSQGNAIELNEPKPKTVPIKAAPGA